MEWFMQENVSAALALPELGPICRQPRAHRKNGASSYIVATTQNHFRCVRNTILTSRSYMQEKSAAAKGPQVLELSQTWEVPDETKLKWSSNLRHWSCQKALIVDGPVPIGKIYSAS